MTAPQKVTPAMQRSLIIGDFVQWDHEFTTARILLDRFPTVFNSEGTARRRLWELYQDGLLDRVWNWDMPTPRYSLTPDYDRKITLLLAEVVNDAGVKGITKEAAQRELLSRVMETSTLRCPRDDRRHVRQLQDPCGAQSGASNGQGEGAPDAVLARRTGDEPLIDRFPLEAATIMTRARKTKVIARRLHATLAVLPIRRDHTRYAFVTNDREAFRAWALRWYPQYCRGETEPVFRLREGMVAYPYNWTVRVR